MGSHRVAVLAGDARAKAVYVIDISHDAVVFSFGVDKETTGLTALSDEGPLLLSVGGTKGAPGSGAIERWTIDGTRTGDLPLPAPGLALTQRVGHVAYVLIGKGHARAAVPINTFPFFLMRPIPLEADVNALAQCHFSDEGSFLLYSTANRKLAARNLATGRIVRSDIAALAPACIDGVNSAYAIARTSSTANAIVLSVPNLSQTSALPLSLDAIALYGTVDHRLMVINSSRRVATAEILPRAEVEKGP